MFEWKMAVKMNTKNTNVGMVGICTNLENAVMNDNHRVRIFGR
jgi:hypothetical protein